MKTTICSIVCAVALFCCISQNFAQIQFSEPKLVFQAEIPALESIYKADIDNDGDVDIVALPQTFDEKTVFWLANEGDGKFGTKQNLLKIPTGSYILLQISDMDNDHLPDIVCYKRDTDSLVWFENNGNGQIGQEFTIDTFDDIFEAPLNIICLDLNMDGNQDILVNITIDDKGEVFYYLNNAQGEFSSRQYITTPEWGANCIFVTDLDGDNDLDVLSTSLYNEHYAWFENDGACKFDSLHVITDSVKFPNTVYAADFDNDGDQDVLTSSMMNTPGLVLYANDGTGHFEIQEILDENRSSINSLFACDIDNDNDLDLVPLGDAYLTFYLNDGNGHLEVWRDYDHRILNITNLVSMDIENDGDWDILVSTDSEYEPHLALYENVGNGNFTAPYSLYATLLNLAAIKAADVDNDGDIDVFSASLLDDKLCWYARQNDGSFGQQQVISDSLQPNYRSFVDLDNDGNIDVLFAVLDDNYIAWFKNDGIGNFTGPNTIGPETHDGLTNIINFDLDNDGDLDIVTVQDHALAWFQNNGHGEFGEKSNIINSVPEMDSICPIDLNDDGFLDLVYIYKDSSKVAWFANKGDGVFDAIEIISNQDPGVTFLTHADLNNDGKTDLITTSSSYNRISYYENSGDGIFGSRITIANSYQKPVNAFTFDMDNDGDLDVFSTAIMNDNKHHWVENSSNIPYFSKYFPALDYFGPWGLSMLSLQDMDNDNDLDILAGSTSSIYWLKNTGVMSGITSSIEKPDDFILHQNYPNPFNPATKISYKVRETGHVSLRIYDILGRQVATLVNEVKPAGQYTITFQPENMADGVYFYKIQTGEHNETRKMILIK